MAETTLGSVNVARPAAASAARITLGEQKQPEATPAMATDGMSANLAARLASLRQAQQGVQGSIDTDNQAVSMMPRHHFHRHHHWHPGFNPGRHEGFNPGRHEGFHDGMRRNPGFDPSQVRPTGRQMPGFDPGSMRHPGFDPGFEGPRPMPGRPWQGPACDGGPRPMPGRPAVDPRFDRIPGRPAVDPRFGDIRPTGRPAELDMLDDTDGMEDIDPGIHRMPSAPDFDMDPGIRRFPHGMGGVPSDDMPVRRFPYSMGGRPSFEKGRTELPLDVVDLKPETQDI